MLPLPNDKSFRSRNKEACSGLFQTLQHLLMNGGEVREYFSSLLIYWLLMNSGENVLAFKCVHISKPNTQQRISLTISYRGTLLILRWSQNKKNDMNIETKHKRWNRREVLWDKNNQIYYNIPVRYYQNRNNMVFFLNSRTFLFFLISF